MLDPVRAKAKVIAVTAASFAGGVLLASGMQWTAGTEAATLLQPAPTPQDVRPLAELSESFISIAESVTPAVVSIRTERVVTAGRNGVPDGVPEEFRRFFPENPGPQTAGGSGFVISADGYIVTNNHVVADATSITVVTMDRREFAAELVGRDPMTDIAVIRINGTRLPTVRFGDPASTRVGEWVIAVGNPLGLDFTVTAGIVSAKNRSIEIIRQNLDDETAGMAVESFIQTDAAINPGNSGGPLVNIRGEVVGVNTAIASNTGLSQGYGFAVPVDLARHVAEDLIRYGRWRRPVLGVFIENVRVEDVEAFDLPAVAGAFVQDFSQANTPAERAGLTPGDVIVAVEGQPVSRVNDLQRTIASHRPGDRVRLETIRYGERRTVEVQLTEAQTPVTVSDVPRNPPSTEDTPPAGLGIRVAPLTEERAREFGYQSTGGVVIDAIDRTGPLGQRFGDDARGLKIVQVDGQPVTDTGRFEQIIREKPANSVVSLVVERPDGVQRIINVRLRR